MGWSRFTPFLAGADHQDRSRSGGRAGPLFWRGMVVINSADIPFLLTTSRIDGVKAEFWRS
jgi:hypothetical protein